MNMGDGVPRFDSGASKVAARPGVARRGTAWHGLFRMGIIKA